MEDSIRLIVFLGVLGGMAAWEVALPWRRAEVPRLIRWSNNLALVVVDAAVVRLVFPVTAVAVAVWAEAAGWGVLTLLGLPLWVEAVLAFVLLDLAIWAQHRVFHAVPVLWRLHRVHHADPEIDVTTGVRFHPAEIVLSMAIKLAVVVALGAPAVAVLLFEVVLNATALFSHSNITLPPAWQRRLGWVVVTPQMHRIHHSERREETDSNFGFNLPWWDWLFGTYRAEAAAGDAGLRIGIGRFGAAADQRIDRLLVQPIRKE
jgi:sterol desaturase/sphingolipid hydroxylase (fatty acid hydroxylase superfamily)